MGITRLVRTIKRGLNRKVSQRKKNDKQITFTNNLKQETNGKRNQVCSS